jgi:hypothetical protein
MTQRTQIKNVLAQVATLNALVAKLQAAPTASKAAFKAVATRKPATAPALAHIAELRLNAKYNGVELVFDGKPQAELRDSMKLNGFRFNSKSVCWYARDTAKARTFARKVVVVLMNATSEAHLKAFATK